VAERVFLRQRSLGEDHGRIADVLTEAFGQMRAGVLAGSPVVVLLDDRDLLGQGSIADAAVATGMLGLVRAFALEGARAGWQVNALTHRGEEEQIDATAELLFASGLTGQLIRVGSDHLGRVWP
jgi:hypothetical protein